MSWQDRDYYRQGPSFGQRPSMGLGLPKPTPIVKYLLIVNIGVFAFETIFRPDAFLQYFALWSSRDLMRIWQVITYQFLHAGAYHLLFNMIALYFLGPHLERRWGPRSFLTFYLVCGVAGGVAFLILGGLTGEAAPIVGASGAILGLLGACAVLFPQMMIILLFFPVPIRVAALLFGGLYVLTVLQSRNLADACHLGGLITGLAWVWVIPLLRHRLAVERESQWEKRLTDEREDQGLVDKILAKVHRQGMQSLTRSEKRALRQATERQRQRDKKRDQTLR